MKIRDEIWVIRGDGSIVPKRKNAHYGESLVVYNETLGFNMHLSSAVIVPFGEPEYQQRISFSHVEGTTFPAVLAVLDGLAKISGNTIIKELGPVGFI